MTELLGRLVGASNETFLVVDDEGARWVYKPVAGERPLWDFPDDTLGRREVAAFVLSEHLGLGVVPETCWGDGPFGAGSFQRFIDGAVSDTVELLIPERLDERWLPVATGIDESGHPVVLAHRKDPRLRVIALFDVLVNNSDRKAGHILDADGRLLGVDHGVTLHGDDKLRTVLWGFAGMPLTDEEVAVVRMAEGIAAPLAPGLTAAEWEAVVDRAAALRQSGVFPGPEGRRAPLPWPAW